MKRDLCLICDSKNLTKILDLGNHAYADTFIAPARAHDLLPVYNLSCAMCEECGQIQTCCITDPDDRYNLYDYSYTSSNSSVARSHWQHFCSDVCEVLNLPREIRVVEIGSNDGYLMGRFKERGATVMGVDASHYVSKIAVSNGIQTINEIFDEQLAEKIIKNNGKFNLAIANNVFNHSDDPLSFARGVNKTLVDDGYFVYELPYWRCSVKSRKFDQVYHEHVSYFTARASKKIMELAGFEIKNIEVVDYHGGSLRVYARKTNEAIPKHCQELFNMIQEESFLFDAQTYHVALEEFQRLKYNFLSKIMEIKLSNLPVVAIGAAAKGNTFLRFMNLDHTIVDYVTDVSSHKQGKLTPLTNIPIVGDEIFAQYKAVYAIILSWNLSDKIKTKLLEINPEIQFLNFYKEFE